MSDRVETDLPKLWVQLGWIEAKYLAAYDAACSLAIFVEHIEAGYPPEKGSILIKDAKEKLQRLERINGSDFFTRFERVK